MRSKGTLQTDAPAAGFFLLGAGAGVWLAVVGRTPAEIIGSALLVLGAVVLASRYFGFPIAALRPKEDVRKQILSDQLGQLQLDGANLVSLTFRGVGGNHVAQRNGEPWEEEVHTLILHALGRAEANVFRTGASNEPPPRSPVWLQGYLDTRVRRISDLIARLPHLPIKDDWQP